MEHMTSDTVGAYVPPHTEAFTGPHPDHNHCRSVPQVTGQIQRKGN